MKDTRSGPAVEYNLTAGLRCPLRLLFWKVRLLFWKGLACINRRRADDSWAAVWLHWETKRNSWLQSGHYGQLHVLYSPIHVLYSPIHVLDCIIHVLDCTIHVVDRSGQTAASCFFWSPSGVILQPSYRPLVFCLYRQGPFKITVWPFKIRVSEGTGGQRSDYIQQPVLTWCLSFRLVPETHKTERRRQTDGLAKIKTR